MPIGPVGNLDESQVERALEAAAAAPSLEDTRVWRLRCTAASIDLYSDRVADHRPRDRAGQEELVECGAALLNLRLAIRSAGVVPDVKLLPDPHRPALVAIVGCLDLDGPIPVGERILVEAIHAHDDLHDRSPVAEMSSPVLDELRVAARVEHGWLSVITAEHRSAVGNLLPDNYGRRPREPVLVCIGSLADRGVDRINAGQALQRVLLTARAAGVVAGVVPRFLDRDGIRLSLRRALGGGLWPQAVLRLGRRSPGPGGADRPAERLPISTHPVELPAPTPT